MENTAEITAKSVYNDMKKFSKIIKKLQYALAEQTIVQEEVLPEDNSAVQEEPWSVDTNTGAMCCGLSEWDFVEATLCGEASGCSEIQRQRVWGVIMNRTIHSKQPSLTRGVCTFTGYAKEVIRPAQFSCWNPGGFGKCADGLNPFASCENLKKRLNCLKGLCGSRPIARGQYTGTSGIDALEQLGFTPEQAVVVRHYMTVKGFLGWKDMCQEAKDKIRDLSEGKDSWVGCTTITCKGITYAVCADGCHLYISGYN